MSFGPDEAERYKRHILLRELGGAGQQRLRTATFALVGVGGLGAPAALYLAAAGAGTLRLVDDDVVSLSNLQRQVLFRTDDIGAPKVRAAAHALLALNPHVRVETRETRLGPTNAADLLAGANVILDGSDSFETRFVVEAASRALKIPLVSGAVGRWDGQVGVFAPWRSPDSPCYRCLVPEAPPDAEPCSTLGIVGALTGIIGATMALEAIKIVTGAGDALEGRLQVHDALSGTVRTVRLPRDPACPACS